MRKKTNMLMKKIKKIVLLTLVGLASINGAQSGVDEQTLQQLRALQSQVAKRVTPQQPGAAISTSQSLTPRQGVTLPAARRPLADEQLHSKATATRLQQARPSLQARPQQVRPALPGMNAPAQRAIDEAAFRSMLRNLMPLSPQQILRLRQMYNVTKFAEASHAGTPPKPVSTSQFVKLSPGSTPPVVRLAKGTVSSVIFLDQTGAPWPIVAYDLGNPKSFNIQWDRKSNILMIQSQDLYITANLAIRLQGLNTPVMLQLIPGQREVDYRVDMRIQGYGPNAKLLPIGKGLPNGNNAILLGVLDGIRPPKSTALEVLGGAADVWTTKHDLFIRTRMTLISPGYKWSYESADGMHAYQVPNPNASVLLASDHGQLVTLHIKGR